MEGKSAFQLAEELFEEGVKAEKEKSFDRALSLFQQAVECFISHVNYVAISEDEKAPARKRCIETLDRAEAIKSFLKKGGTLPKTFSSCSSVPKSADKKKSSDSDDDHDAKKLKDRINQAILGEKFDISYDDIIGLEDVKSALEECVVFPLKYPSLMKQIGEWKAILLFGPPGVGKTLIAKAVASESGSTMFSVSSSTLGSKYIGEGENLVGELFNEAREKKPSIIFFDELEWLCSERKHGTSSHDSKMKAELLAQMDGTKGDNSQVLVLGATNLPHTIDGAFLRRFTIRIYVPLPNLEARVELFRKKLSAKESTHTLTDADLKDLGARTENYNGSDITNIITRAKLEGIYKIRKATHFKEVAEGYFTPCAPTEEDAQAMKCSEIHESKIIPPPVSYIDVMKALQMLRPSSKSEALATLETFDKKYGFKSEGRSAD